MRQIAEHRQGVDRVLDALARTEEAPRQQLRVLDETRIEFIRPVDDRQRRAVRDGDDVTVADVVQPEQAVLRRLRHHDDAIRKRADGFEDRSLVRGRQQGNRVEDHDRRHFEGLEEVDDLIAVYSAVDAVLVLDECDVTFRQHRGRGMHRRRLARRAERRRGPIGVMSSPSSMRTTSTR
jgi:hypothetical protein